MFNIDYMGVQVVPQTRDIVFASAVFVQREELFRACEYFDSEFN